MNITDEQLMDAVHKVRASGRVALTCERTKDGIDVTEPTYILRELAREIAALAAPAPQPEMLAKLLQAVEATEYDGIRCLDVDGVNWFDARDDALKTIPPSVAGRKPLTEGQIAELWKVWLGFSTMEPTALVRMVERAHGITAAPMQAPKCTRPNVACAWPECGADCRHAAPKDPA